MSVTVARVRERTKVSFVCPLSLKHPRGRVHSVRVGHETRQSGNVLPFVTCEEADNWTRYYLLAHEEGIRWARGWDGETRRALEAAWRLTESAW